MLRTLARRVEAIAAAWEPCEGKRSRRLLESIRPVRKAAGRVRDMDVLAGNVLGLLQDSRSGPLVRLVEHLRSARRAYANALLRAVSRRRKAACRSLEQYSMLARSGFARRKSASSAGASQAENALRSAAMKLASELGRWPELNERSLHGFRIKVKHLRCILHLFADSDPGLLEALGGVNIRIGDWHDWQQLKEIAEAIPGEPLDRVLLTEIGKAARRKLTHAVAAGNALRKKYLHSTPRRARAA
jgi:CHAD domain-containing protein